jgi:hypothetical protein
VCVNFKKAQFPLKIQFPKKFSSLKEFSNWLYGPYICFL